MTLDVRVCERVRIARDSRFDGRFYIGVLTTGVYCRPICPSPTSRSENVRYYRSASDAAAAGFRACRRCRPDTAPGSPVWFGTSSTVTRALRLIVEGALREESLATIARRLGVGGRHLHRLFETHLGASPAAIARTWRLNHARRLLRETDLPMSRVALASGFRTVRRFNDAVRRLYGRTPTVLRRESAAASDRTPDEYFFRVAYRPPYDGDALFAFLAARAIPGVEEAAGDAYRRTFTQDGRHGVLDVRRHDTARALEIHVRFTEPLSLLPIVSRVRAMFDVAANAAAIAGDLRGDPLVGPLAALRPGLRVPGAWDPFELAVRGILGRGKTIAEETAVAGDLAQRLGEPLRLDAGPALLRVFPTAVALARAPDGALPGSAVRPLRALCRIALGGAFGPEASEAEALERLAREPEVGADVAELVRLRAFGDPDGFPAGDPSLLGTANRTPAELAAASETWRPWRGYAAAHLWRAADADAPRARMKVPARRRRSARTPARAPAVSAGAS